MTEYYLSQQNYGYMNNINNKLFNSKNFIPTNSSSEYEEDDLIKSLDYVKEKYGSLIELNEKNIGIVDKTKQQSNCRFYVIKSFTEEDIHKVIFLCK